MGQSGIDVVEQELNGLKKQLKPDLVLAQAENVTEGRGISKSDFEHLRTLGIDFCTGGNWSLYREDIVEYLNDPKQPIIRPANYPQSTAGLGYKYVSSDAGKVLVISLLGQVVGRDANKAVDNPLQVVDAILNSEQATAKAAIIVNFHGDYSSEKRIIGYYLDGRVSAVIGDHWHVPTADAMLLPSGTAHITDVGMCGSLDSSLGIKLSSVIPRWRDNTKTRNVLESEGRRQLNGVLVDIDTKTTLAKDIQFIQKIIA